MFLIITGLVCNRHLRYTLRICVFRILDTQVSNKKKREKNVEIVRLELNMLSGLRNVSRTELGLDLNEYTLG